MIDNNAPASLVHSASSSGERKPTSDRGLQAERGYSISLARLTDAQLADACAAARARAHDAPKCISGTEEAPYTSGNTWAIRTREWMALKDEIDRRSVIAGQREAKP